MDSKMDMYKKLNAELIEQIQKMKIEQASCYREVASLRKELLDSHEALITIKSTYAEKVKQLCSDLLKGLEPDGKYEEQCAEQACNSDVASRTYQESFYTRKTYDDATMRNDSYIEQRTILEEQRNEISKSVLNDAEFSADANEEDSFGSSVETISSDEAATSDIYEETLINANTESEEMLSVEATNINEVSCDLYAIEEEAESESLLQENDTTVQQAKAAKAIQRRTRSGSAVRESLAQRKSAGKQGAFDTVAPALSEITQQEANKLNRMSTRNMSNQQKIESKECKTKVKAKTKVPKNAKKVKGKTTKQKTTEIYVHNDDDDVDDDDNNNIENQSIPLPRRITELETIISIDASTLPRFELAGKSITPNKTLICAADVTAASCFGETQLNLANFDGLPSSTPNSIFRRASNEYEINLLQTTIESNQTTRNYKANNNNNNNNDTTIDDTIINVNESAQRRPRRQCRPTSLTEVNLKLKLRNDKELKERPKRRNK